MSTPERNRISPRDRGVQSQRSRDRSSGGVLLERLRGSFPNLYLSVPRGLESADGRAAWVYALGTELRIRRAEGVRLRTPLTSILVGGEAPSTLGARLAGQVASVLDRQGIEAGEWTVEIEAKPAENRARPTLATLRSWVAGGVTRICVRADPSAGLGGWDFGRLGLLDRVVESGVPTVAADVLVGGSDVAAEDLCDRMAEVVNRGVDHLSLYEGDGPSPGDRAPDEGSIAPDSFAETWHQLVDALAARGLHAFDLVNYGRPGCESSMGRSVRRRHPVLGLGPGARSFRNPERRWNVAGWEDYHHRLRGHEDPEQGGESLSPAQVCLERIWCRLQGTEGLPLPAGVQALDERIATWEERDWIERHGARLHLLPEGRLRLDGLAVEISHGLASPRRESSTPRSLE